VSSENLAAAESRRASRPQRLFTVESANQALVLVRRIVQDVVTIYGELMNLRSRREDLAVTQAEPSHVSQVAADIDEKVRRLRSLQEELGAIGCELKDWASGLVDFPARRKDRIVFLCWKLGEPRITHWHEVHAGFAGRRPLDAGFPEADAASAEPRNAPD
jgi:hypothetical protein